MYMYMHGHATLDLIENKKKTDNHAFIIMCACIQKKKLRLSSGRHQKHSLSQSKQI